MRTGFYILVMGLSAATGCAPGWYEASADREVARIVEQRKEQTLKYKPQSEAKTPKNTEPTTRAYAKIPMTVISPPAPPALQVPDTKWNPEPQGPLSPPVVDDRLDFVPPSYATAGAFAGPQGPQTPGTVHVVLDLQGAVEYAVTHSRPYQDQMENLFLATLDVTLARHLFEPQPFASTSVRYDGNQGGRNPTTQPTQYQSALSVVNKVGVKQQLPYGGEIAAQQLVTMVNALNDTTADGDSARTSLTASIPLLKGAGMVNLEPLIDSERNLIYAVRSFELYRRQFAVDIATRFFALVTQQQGINNRRVSYENNRVLSERAMELFGASRPGSSYLDVQRAQQSLLNAESSLIDAVTLYQGSLDNFKIVLGMPVEADLEIVPVELQVNPPDVENVNVADLATKYRLDLQTARDRIEDAQRDVKNAKNGLLPNVTLDAFSGVGNFNEAGRRDRWYQYNSDTYAYGASVTVDWPLDQLADRNIYRRSLINLARTQRSYVTSRDQVISDVRNDTRLIRVAQISVDIQRRSVELNQKRLDLANERYLQGRVAVLDVTDAQSALLSAQDGLDRARANLQTQVLQYLRDTGTLRVDPQAGAIGRAMDRQALQASNMREYEKLEQELEKVERQ